MEWVSIIFIIICFLLLFVFMVRSRIVGLMSTSLKLGFFGLMAVGFSAILIPALYENISDFLLKQVGVYESVQQLDSNFIVSTITSTTSDAIESLQDIFGEGVFDDSSISEAFFEENLYPVLVSTVALIIRISAAVISLLGMLGAIYLSFATTSVSDTQALRKRCEQLEARIAQLESLNGVE